MNTQPPEPYQGRKSGLNGDFLITIDKVGRLAPEPNTPEEAQRTTKVLWFVAYVVIMILVAARLPLAVREAASKIPEDVKRELGDDRLLSFSTTAGGILFVITYAVVMALYLALAAFLDRRIIRTKTKVARLNVGMYFAIALASTVPVQLTSVIAQIADVRVIPGFYWYYPTAVTAILVCFRRHWIRLATRRKAVVITAAAALTLLAVLG